jgi:hypothetical protein
MNAKIEKRKANERKLMESKGNKSDRALGWRLDNWNEEEDRSVIRTMLDQKPLSTSGRTCVDKKAWSKTGSVKERKDRSRTTNCYGCKLIKIKPGP